MGGGCGRSGAHHGGGKSGDEQDVFHDRGSLGSA
jgi:hypothetical protein